MRVLLSAVARRRYGARLISGATLLFLGSALFVGLSEIVIGANENPVLPAPPRPTPRRVSLIPPPMGQDLQATGTLCFVFTGSRRSELEPCGCHDRQTGGVNLEALLYEKLRKVQPNVIAMDAGAWTDPFQTPNERLKTDYLVKALNLMQFDVYNVTPYDIAFGTTYPTQLIAGGPGRLISANLMVRPRDAAGTTAVPAVRPYDPYTIIEVSNTNSTGTIRIGVIGVTDPAALETATLQRLQDTSKQMPAFELAGVAETLKTFVPEVRKKADYVVVLAMMNRQNVPVFLGQVEGIDCFVSTWGIQTLRNLMGNAQRTIINTGHQGRYFTKTVVDFDEARRAIKVTGGLVDIPSSGTGVVAVEKLLEQYKEDTKNLQRQMAVAREKSRFAGRVQCLGCHRAEYLQWTRTPHNVAYATLIQKNQHYNPDCLKCHVTGYGEADGFADPLQTSHLVAVQCESCHGPGREHVKVLLANPKVRSDPQGRREKLGPEDDYPRLRVEFSSEFCVTCHDPENDPDFDFDNDIKLVSHQNLNGPFRRKKATAAPTPAPVTSAPQPTAPKATPQPRAAQ